MAKINRYTGNVAAPASAALGTERTIFGDVTQSDALDDNLNADLLRGWGIVGVNENPTKQDFNGLAFTLGQLIAYLHQAGVAEYDAAQEYFNGGSCQVGGQLYISQTDGNIGNNPVGDDGTNWHAQGLTQVNDLDTLRTIAGSTGRHIYTKQRETPGDGGGGVWRWNGADLSAEVTIDPQSGVYVAPNSDLTGASGAWVRLFDKVEADFFGVVADYNGVSGTDNTVALQAAIDFVLESDKYAEVVLPAGRILYSTISLYKPGSSNLRAQRGKITLVGRGNLAQSDVFGTTAQHYGTELVSSQATGNDVVVSNNDSLVRKIEIRNLTIVSQTNGYAVQAEYCPEFEMDRVSIRVTNAAGKGVKLADVWFSKIHRCRIIADTGITSTGYGIEFSSTLFAGLHEISGGTQIDNFQDNYFVNAGTNWTSIIWENSASQKHSQYGWRIEGPVWNFTIRDCYVETGSGTSHVYTNPSAGVVKNLIIDGLFMLGGDTTSSFLTGPAIDINQVETYDIKNLMYYRPWTAMLDVTQATNGSALTSGTVGNFNVDHDNVAALPAGPFYLLTGNVDFTIGAYDVVSTTKIEVFDDTVNRAGEVNSKYMIPNSFATGALKFASVSATVYDLANDSPRPITAIINATGAGAGAVRLPRANTVRDTDMRYVYNDPASTQNIDLRNGALASAIATLTPGEGAICHADPTNDKWLIIQATASYGT